MKLNQSLIFICSIFFSAFLLFLVQPMAGKALLPTLGGAPSVWNTAMLFFQFLLLGGYLYAHLLGQIKLVKTQVMIHGALLIAAFSSLPMTISFEAPGADISPLWWQLTTMIGMIGLPFFALSTSAPLLQKWFSVSDHPQAHSPYFLYAASNVGSILGLVLYPVLVEQFFPLDTQTSLFKYGFGLLGALVFGCGLTVIQKIQTPAETHEEAILKADGLRPSMVMTWLLLAFVPSSLMLGYTTFVTSDIGSAPLFWVIPLMLYILSFILAFSRKKLFKLSHIKLAYASLFFLSAIVANHFVLTHEWAVAITYGVLFFITALMCHQQLEELKPSAKHLTLFFLILSVGGALGGILNALIAPLVFVKPYEFMLVMAVSLFCWNIGNKHLFLPIIGMILMLITPIIPYEIGNYKVPYESRNYFGTLAVKENDEIKTLSHGKTIHGAQLTNPKYKNTPISYYHPTSANADAFEIQKQLKGKVPLNTASLGLGSGAIACLLRPQDEITFFEIDPHIISVASNKQLFSYLSDCGPKVSIHEGDARLKLKEISDQSYDVLLVDVFSGDNIPMHLLTLEAIQLYLQKVKPDGFLVIHISNRFMKLEPEIGRISQSIGIPAFQRISKAVPIQGTQVETAPTNSIILTRNHQAKDILGQRGWKLLSDVAYEGQPWTDSYANPLRALLAK